MHEIIENLRIDKPLVVSIVGAGGKTTLMASLARELGGKVVCSTSTKLGLAEPEMFEEHLIIPSAFDFSELSLSFESKNIVITAESMPIEGVDKWVGLNQEQLAKLISICGKEKLALVIEADGAKKRLIKAPANWEPVIPAESNLVISMLSLDAIGKPLSEETVFRSDLFCELSGGVPGSDITMDYLLKYLMHPLGGKKGIPDPAIKYMVFTATDKQKATKILQAQQLRELSSYFDGVFLGSFELEGPTYKRFPDG